MSGIPAWERLRAPDRQPLVIGPVTQFELDTLRIVDGDAPQLDGATVFDAWRSGAQCVVRAAAVGGHHVRPWQVVAARLEVTGDDGRLAALLGEDAVVAADGQLEHQACACRGVSADRVYRAIGAGWSTVEQLKRATRVSFGECQGRRCVPWLAARLELDPDDPRARVRTRPPLVPVPLALLAAYAGLGTDASSPAAAP